MRRLFILILLCQACSGATEPECVTQQNWAPVYRDSALVDSVLFTVRLCFYEY